MDGLQAVVPEATTLPERKYREAARRMAAADAVVREMRIYARAHGGRFVLFGSYLTAAMRHDSDLDVLVDFPTDRTADAWSFAEELGGRYAIPVDLHDAHTTKARFVARVVQQGMVIA